MSLKDAFAGMKQANAEPEQIDRTDTIKQVPKPSQKTIKKPVAATALPVPSNTPSASARQDTHGKTGKSSSPEFERLTVYVRKRTKKVAARKWEDDTGGDMSELVEDLLTKYLSS